MTMEKVIKNAIIDSIDISSADYGVLSAWLYLDYGGTNQGFGGYSLYLPKDFKHHGGANYAGHFIYRCMQIAGVEHWKDLNKKHIRVEVENGLIKGIGNIVSDVWFCPKEEFLQLEAQLTHPSLTDKP